MSEYERYRERPEQSRPEEWERESEYREEIPYEDGLVCPYCRQQIPNAEADTCMHCNRYIRLDICSFCGADISPDTNFCESCGAPHGEVACPACGASNFTAFCSHCGEALTQSAVQLLEMFRETPQYHRMEHLCEEIAAIELELEKMEDMSSEEYVEDEPLPEPQENIIAASSAATRNEAERQQIQERAAARMKIINRRLGGNLCTSTGEAAAPAPSPAPAQPIQREPVRRKQAKLVIQPEDIEEKKRQKAAHEQQIAQMMADFAKCPTLNPVEARNYYMAQKPKDLDMYWICNRFGCCHNSPKDCSAPQYGGTWHVRYGDEELTVD